VKLYQQLVFLLASRIDSRLERDADARASGIIINTSGWNDQAGYDILLQCVQAFSVDVVLVMGHDKLYSKFSADVGDHVTVVKLPKSGGVVERVSHSSRLSVIFLTDHSSPWYTRTNDIHYSNSFSYYTILFLQLLFDQNSLFHFVSLTDISPLLYSGFFI
jgi:mRNA cleavage and polyadenylation factor CLP1 P-loop